MSPAAKKTTKKKAEPKEPAPEPVDTHTVSHAVDPIVTYPHHRDTIEKDAA